jgi:hypothetical protein
LICAGGVYFCHLEWGVCLFFVALLHSISLVVSGMGSTT